MERERQVKRKSGPWCYELVELVWCSIEHVGVSVGLVLSFLLAAHCESHHIASRNSDHLTSQKHTHTLSLSFSLAFIKEIVLS